MEKKIYYKAFQENMYGQELKKFEVGGSYEIKGRVKCGARGFHAAVVPFRVLSHYTPYDSRFCIVELSGDIDKQGYDRAASRIRILREISLRELFDAEFEYVKSHATLTDHGISNYITTDEQYALVYSGNMDFVAVNGSGIHIASEHKGTQIALSGNNIYVASKGSYASIAASGISQYVFSTGPYAMITSSGAFTDIVSYGRQATIIAAGITARVDSYGEGARVVCTNYFSAVKARKGSMVTLTERSPSGMPISKTEVIDGVRLKELVPYVLSNGEFVEAVARNIPKGKTVDDTKLRNYVDKYFQHIAGDDAENFLQHIVESFHVDKREARRLTERCAELGLVRAVGQYGNIIRC